MNRKSLPIYQKQTEILATFRNNQVLVLAAPTGSGKSTQIPPMLLESGLAGDGMIGVTVPRVVVAYNLADWVAEQDGTETGDVYGFHTGRDRCFDQYTKVKYMTEGILLGEMHSDPLLKRYSTIVLDEVHERSINIDLIMALLLPILEKRQDLKLIVMSATLDTQLFAKRFDGAPVIEVPGKMYPVEVRYLEKTPWSLNTCLDVCVEEIEWYVKNEEGDILVFLPDEASINRVLRMCEQKRLPGVDLHRLFGRQDPEEQRAALRRGRRRVILSTNIAETSLTIDGCRICIDTGYIKAMTYVNAAMSSLQVTEHSKAGMDQRKGRVGRTAPGICVRLMDKYEYRMRPAFLEPEIKRSSLDAVLLQLRCLGYTLDQIMELRLPSPPTRERWMDARSRLRTFGALSESNEVTKDGQIMNKLPVSPMLGRMILAARDFGCVSEMITIVAGMSSRPVMYMPKNREEHPAANMAHMAFKHETGDALTTITLWDAYQNKRRELGRDWFDWAKQNYLSSRALSEIARNRKEIADRLDRSIELSSNREPIVILKAVAAGLIVNICRKSGKYEYTWPHGNKVFIHPGSAMFGTNPPQWMVCTEVVETSKSYARGCNVIQEDWINEFVPADAIDVSWSLEQDILDDSWYLCRKATWQGMEIKGRARLQEIPWDEPQMLQMITKRIVEGITGGMFSMKVLIATDILRKELDEIIKVRYQKRGYGYLEHNDREDVIRRLYTTACLNLAKEKPKTVSELQGLTFAFPLEDWLTPEQIAAHQERMQAEREAAEARAKAEAERMAAMQAKQDERRASLREKAEHYRFLLSQKHLLDGIRVSTYQSWILNDLGHKLRRLDSYGTDTILRDLAQIEGLLRIIESKLEDRKSLTTKIWDTVLKAYPVCPLCGHAWETYSDKMLFCPNDHEDDKPRLVKVGRGNIDRRRKITIFMTEESVLAAQAELSSAGEMRLRFDVAKDHPWTKPKFKNLIIEDIHQILPNDLTKEAESIQNDLKDLHDLRKRAKAQALDIAKATHKVSRTMEITFDRRDPSGKPYFQNGAARYVVPFTEYNEDKWPDAGETWICKLGVRSGREVNVTPLMQLEPIKIEIEEHVMLMQECYPGLPESLLK